MASRAPNNLEEFKKRVRAIRPALEAEHKRVIIQVSDDIFGQIVAKSPVRTGRYRGSNTVNANVPDQNYLPRAPKEYDEPGLEFYKPPSIDVKARLAGMAFGSTVWFNNSVPYAGE